MVYICFLDVPASGMLFVFLYDCVWDVSMFGMCLLFINTKQQFGVCWAKVVSAHFRTAYMFSWQLLFDELCLGVVSGD